MSFEKVICPYGSRPESPVTISVLKKGKQALFGLTFSAPLAKRAGLAQGARATLYADVAARQIKVAIEPGPDSRKVRGQSGSRLSVEFPYRPFSKLLPVLLYATPAKLLTAAKGEIILELPVIKPKS